MKLEIPHEMIENIKKTSKELGLDSEELIQRAIKLYIHNMREYIDLKKELKAWEEAGLEDMSNFEQQI